MFQTKSQQSILNQNGREISLKFQNFQNFVKFLKFPNFSTLINFLKKFLGNFWEFSWKFQKNFFKCSKIEHFSSEGIRVSNRKLYFGTRFPIVHVVFFYFSNRYCSEFVCASNWFWCIATWISENPSKFWALNNRKPRFKQHFFHLRRTFWEFQCNFHDFFRKIKYDQLFENLRNFWKFLNFFKNYQLFKEISWKFLRIFLEISKKIFLMFKKWNIFHPKRQKEKVSDQL